MSYGEVEKNGPWRMQIVINNGKLVYHHSDYCLGTYSKSFTHDCSAPSIDPWPLKAAVNKCTDIYTMIIHRAPGS